jgi:GH25 family lysozyme M1 (1,4-beta-N-acetylmuramidase)
MIKGADISEYRLVTNIDQYVASGRSFLAFKATGGAKGWNYTDPTLAKNLALVKANGLHGLAYHFLRQGMPGIMQADHFLSKIPHQGIVLVCDFEFHEPSNSFPTPGELNDFVNRVKLTTGRWPWVYTSRGVWGSLVVPATTAVAPECPLWIADWTDPLEPVAFGGWTKAVLRQYTDHEPVPGIDKPCDDNMLLGTELDLLRGAWGSENVSAEDRGWGPPCPADSIIHIQPTTTRGFNVHRRVAKIFDTFVRELESRGYDIEAGQLDDWSYNCRKIAGSDSWSNHAWGLAIDINSLRNPMGSTLVTDMPSWVRDKNYLLTKYGLKWGGTYVNRPDAMHFEFILTPADADRITAALGDNSMSAAEVDELKTHITNTMIHGVRYVDHGNKDELGSGNHHKLIRAELAALKVLVAEQADDETKLLAAFAEQRIDPAPLVAAIIAGLKAEGVISVDVDEDALAGPVGDRVLAALQNVTFTATSDGA